MEKFKVSFEANNQQLKSIGTKHASDTYADIEATFVLGEKWTDMDSVSAVWWNDFTRVATVLDSNGKCIVPHEVLTRKGCVRVNLVGSIVEGDELITRLTSYSAEAVQVNEKIKLTGSETSELTPSQFEQFVTEVKADADRAETVRDEAEAARDVAVSAKDTAVNAVEGFEDIVDTATATAVQTIQGEGATQVTAIQTEGTTQVASVRTEGSTQVTAVQDKGDEVLDSIPADYTQLSQNVTDLKSDLNELSTAVGFSSTTQTWSDRTYTYIGAGDTKTILSASVGDTLEIEFSGTAINSNSNALMYLEKNGTYSSSGKNLSTSILNTVVLDTDITAIGFYLTNLTPNGEVTANIKIIAVDGVLNADKTYIKKSDYVLESVIPTNFILSGERLVCRLGLIAKGGRVEILSVPNGCSFALEEYTANDYAYANQTYNSGWQTSAGLIKDVIDNRYYNLVIKRTDNTAIPNVNVANDFEIVQYYDTKKQVEENADNIDNLLPFTPKTVKTIAHRGDQIAAPKNTKPAYIVARKRGIEIAENDVTLSSDGNYICWHDPTFGVCGNLVDINGYLMYTDGSVFYYYDSINSKLYTYNNGYTESSVSVSTLTRCAGSNYTPQSLPLDVLKRIDVGGYKGSNFSGTQILTFEEWVVLCKKLGMGIYVDRKIDWTNTQLEDLAEIVKSNGMSKHTSWLNIYAEQIPVLRNVIDGARVGLLTHPTENLISAYTQYNVGDGVFFNGDAKNGMTRASIQLGLTAGFDVEVYYVDYPNEADVETIFSVINTAIEYGVTSISLDHYTVEDVYAQMLEEY